MSIALREENFVVINVGSKFTTAGIGMHDTNKPPSVVSKMTIIKVHTHTHTHMINKLSKDCQYG